MMDRDTLRLTAAGTPVLRALWALWSFEYNKGDHRAALRLA